MADPKHGKPDSVSEKDVKAPNVFKRAKEEVEAIFHTEKPSRHHHETHGRSNDIDEKTPIDKVKGPSVFERAKEEVEAIIHLKKSPRHHHETHGRNNDIDENTPVTQVKGPNVFERMKEEVEALVQAIHPKKDTKKDGSSSK